MTVTRVSVTTGVIETATVTAAEIATGTGNAEIAAETDIDLTKMVLTTE